MVAAAVAAWTKVGSGDVVSRRATAMMEAFGADNEGRRSAFIFFSSPVIFSFRSKGSEIKLKPPRPARGQREKGES